MVVLSVVGHARFVKADDPARHPGGLGNDGETASAYQGGLSRHPGRIDPRRSRARFDHHRRSPSRMYRGVHRPRVTGRS